MLEHGLAENTFDRRLYGCKETSKPSALIDILVNAADRTENKPKRGE